MGKKYKICSSYVSVIGFKDKKPLNGRFMDYKFVACLNFVFMILLIKLSVD